MPFLGGDPWGAFAKHLREAGHDVSVLTTSAFGSLPDDDANGVVRTGDLNAARPLRWLLRRPALESAGSGSSTVKPAPALLTKVFVPDPFVVSWAPAAVRVGRRIMRERSIDCLITTSPTESSHIIGLAMRRDDTAWLADFRDGWTFEPLRAPFPTRAQRALDRRLECRVVRRADRVLAATRPLADDFRRRLNADAAWIPNPWDPGALADIEAAEPPPVDRERFSLVYTGTLGSARRGHDTGAFMTALRHIVESEPELAKQLEVVIAGRLTQGEEATFAEPGFRQVVSPVGPLPRSDALALQRQADGLLLITSRHASPASGKLVEYLAAGKPILALADGNEPARIVSETGTGVNVPPDDPPAIVEALRAAIRGELARAYAPRDIERYTHPAPAEELRRQVEAAIARRSA
jgi:glycosyltransferase involved in cell wall biosynthesis